MRNLFLLRGAPGSGKSTFIDNNGLQEYTLSPDKIRTMAQCPAMDVYGKLVISQANESYVWDLLKELLEKKMQRGETVFIDATHYRAALINGYNKLIKKYRYRAYIVDFTDIPLEQCLAGNISREEYKHVPAETIRKMYACFEYSKEIASRFKVISRNECLDMLKDDSCLFDMNGKHENIYVFGDIHGCLEPLRRFEEEYGFNDSDLYIFTGDYLDRGLQNADVANWLIVHEPLKNFMFLEGNHEAWLRAYANNTTDEIRSTEFLSKTRHDLENGGVSIKGLKKFCARLAQMAYFKFGDRKYFISHGGMPKTPDILTTTAKDLIRGVGRYDNLDKVYETWRRNYDDYTVLIHAHRNLHGFPIKAESNIYNLCSNIEYGEPLRCIKIAGNNVEAIEINNTVFRRKDDEASSANDNNIAGDEAAKTKHILDMMAKNTSMIRIKDCSNGVKSYNFTREAFYSRDWNNLTCKARGLFVRNGAVVARSYDKFFNIDEMPESSIAALKKRKFPATVYKKENGFLGLVSAAGVFTKTTDSGDYAEIFKNILNEKHINIDVFDIAERDNCTFVFECVDAKNDPHIIEYPENEIFLLDIMHNSLTDCSKKSYEELCDIAAQLGVKAKERIAICNTWEELKPYVIEGVQVKTMDNPIEGYVIEFDDGFMTKSKTFYYRKWKKARSWLQTVEKGRPLQPSYVDEYDVKIASFIKSLKNPSRYNIIDVQNEYYRKEDRNA